MADARALLRAHRAENRVKHPHAAYSDAGKLLCKLCQNIVKSESLWDTHLRSQSHRERSRALQQQQQHNQDTDECTHKRKRSEDDNDEHMSDGDEDANSLRAKRSKTDIFGQASIENDTENGTDASSREKDKDKMQTPPGLSRRTSGTPVQGVEIAIPSRPATPLAGSTSAVSTPKVTSVGRSPLIGSDAGASAQQTTALKPTSKDLLAVPGKSNSTSAGQTSSSGAVDEAEWAAFEAEMSSLDAAAPVPNSHLYADASSAAVISAPALTAAQLAAKSQEEENERRKQVAETAIADEREDATRALENEFEEMEELEGRVRRLKERREALRKGSVLNPLNPRGAASGVNAVDGKENNSVRSGAEKIVHEEDDEDDDNDYEDDDEWFRA